MDCMELSIACFTVTASKLRLTIVMMLPKRGALPVQRNIPPATLKKSCHPGDSAACNKFQVIGLARQERGLECELETGQAGSCVIAYTPSILLEQHLHSSWEGMGVAQEQQGQDEGSSPGSQDRASG